MFGQHTCSCRQGLKPPECECGHLRPDSQQALLLPSQQQRLMVAVGAECGDCLSHPHRLGFPRGVVKHSLVLHHPFFLRILLSLPYFPLNSHFCSVLQFISSLLPLSCALPGVLLSGPCLEALETFLPDFREYLAVGSSALESPESEGVFSTPPPPSR